MRTSRGARRSDRSVPHIDRCPGRDRTCDTRFRKPPVFRLHLKVWLDFRAGPELHVAHGPPRGSGARGDVRPVHELVPSPGTRLRQGPCGGGPRASTRGVAGELPPRGQRASPRVRPSALLDGPRVASHRRGGRWIPRASPGRLPDAPVRPAPDAPAPSNAVRIGSSHGRNASGRIGNRALEAAVSPNRTSCSPSPRVRPAALLLANTV